MKEVDRALADLDRQLSRKIIRQSMRSAMKPMLDAARTNAPIGVDRLLRGKHHQAGSLRKNIKVRAARARGRGTIAVRVATSAKDYVGEQFYASMVEFGTVKQRAQNYMRRAFDATKEAVRERTVARIREMINVATPWYKKI